MTMLEQIVLFRDNRNVIILDGLAIVNLDGTETVVSDATVTGALTTCDGGDEIALSFSNIGDGRYEAVLLASTTYARNHYELEVNATATGGFAAEWVNPVYVTARTWPQ